MKKIEKLEAEKKHLADEVDSLKNNNQTLAKTNSKNEMLIEELR